MLKRHLLILFSCVWLASCASYYTKKLAFNSKFESGNYVEAEKELGTDAKEEKRKTKFLYYVNRGAVLHMLGNYEESNVYFEKAYIFLEDFKEKIANQAASFLVNPKMTYYTGEEHERLLIHYYKALNYIKLNQYDVALVEVKRMNIRLNELNDRYKNKNKYQKDAFIHLLMGVVYDINKDYNNAFIAYRNAYEIYVSDYSDMFKISVPQQLKIDLIRTARLSGIDTEQYRFEKAFGIKYSQDLGDANVFVLWNNGLGPVKDEISFTFTLTNGGGGNITMSNADLGMSFTYPKSSYSSSGADFGDIQVVRVVMPVYVERALRYTSGEFFVNDVKVSKLDEVENINAVAFRVLDDRYLKELTEELIRVAIKQALAESARKENENLGAALSIMNAFTQSADTRNWQTIPHTIYYTRVNLKEGENTLLLKASDKNGKSVEERVEVSITRGKHQVVTFNTSKSNQKGAR